MKNRSDSILVYKNIEDNRVYCRIGICNELVSCHRICGLLRNYTCCVYGSRNEKYTEQFHFDNTKHEIVLSTNTCKLCDECTGIISCRHEIRKYIDVFVEKIGSVEARK